MDDVIEQLGSALEDRDSDLALEILRDYPKLDVNGLYQGDTPLRLAAQANDLAVARVLIHRGAQPNDGGIGRMSPLASACRDGHVDMAILLLNAGAGVQPTEPGGSTPLHQAARQNDPTLIDRLVEAGAPLDVPWDAMGTPLHLAVSNGRRHAVQALLRHGASTSMVDGQGRTPLMLAADPVIAQSLVDHEQALLRAVIAHDPGIAVKGMAHVPPRVRGRI